MIPDLKGKFDGFSLRVPTPTVSVVDFTAELEQATSRSTSSTQAFRDAAAGPLKGILGATTSRSSRPTSAATAAPRSSTSPSNMVLGGNFVKVIAWYDNEWGYSCRVADLVAVRRRAPA